MRTQMVRMALVATAIGIATSAAAPAAGEPMHPAPDAGVYGSCPTGWELWWVPDHLGWFEYTLNSYEDKNVNGDAVLCRKTVTGKGVQSPDHDHVWVAKDNKALR